LIIDNCCFRHLEKPIKTRETKENIFIVFPVFLEGESKIPKRKFDELKGSGFI
jgi:hypothetical protein